MHEPYQNQVNVNLKPEISRGQEQVNLIQSQRARPQQSRQIAAPNPAPKLNAYQKGLLEELKSRPKVVDLLRVIFSQYPSILIKEFKQNSPVATNRQRKQAAQTSTIRMQIESYIEEEVAKLSGIDIESLLKAAKDEAKEKAVPEVPETPVEETPVEETPVEETPVEETPVEETPVEETPVEETPVEEDVSNAVKKKTKKKTSKKVSKKVSRKEE